MVKLNNHNTYIKMIECLEGRKMIYNGCSVCHESNVPLRYHVAPLPLFTQ